MAILNKYFLKSLQGLVYLFPLSFIFGNMIINLFVVLISLLGIIYYNKNLLSWFDKKILILICVFFNNYNFYILSRNICTTLRGLN